MQDIKKWHYSTNLSVQDDCVNKINTENSISTFNKIAFCDDSLCTQKTNNELWTKSKTRVIYVQYRFKITFSSWLPVPRFQICELITINLSKSHDMVV